MTKEPFKVKFERVTPERAQQLLDTQPSTGESRNRSIAQSRVNRYIDDMANGFWETTHQGVAIDENGILMDGQHRLQAIVEADTPVVLMICEGVPRSTFWLMDGGLTRSAQSFLDGKYAVQRSALARTVLQLEENGGVARISNIGHGKFASHRILRFISDRADLRDYGEGFSAAALRAADRNRGHFVGTSVVGLLVGGFIVGPEHWTRWWEDVHAIRVGEGLENGNPVRALYNCSPVGGNFTNVNYMRAIYAADKFRRGEDLKQIRTPVYHEVKVW